MSGHIDVDALLRERANEHSTFLFSTMLFGNEWTTAATHEQRQHRIDHAYTGFPWTYEDGPAGFSAEHPFGNPA